MKPAVCMLGRLLGRVPPHDRGLSMLRTAEVEQSGERGDPRMLFFWVFLDEIIPRTRWATRLCFLLVLVRSQSMTLTAPANMNSKTRPAMRPASTSLASEVSASCSSLSSIGTIEQFGQTYPPPKWSSEKDDCVDA